MNGSGKVQAKLFFPFLLDVFRHESWDKESSSQKMFARSCAYGFLIRVRATLC